MKTAKDILVEDLTAHLDTIDGLNRVFLDRMIEKANAGYYGDRTSSLAAPQSQLYADARVLGLDDIAENVAAGKYDG